MNILFLLMAVVDPAKYEKPDKKTTDAYEQGFDEKTRIARELSSDPLFALGFWRCLNNHDFDRARIDTPQICPVCHTRYVKWVPGPGATGLQSNGPGSRDLEPWRDTFNRR